MIFQLYLYNVCNIKTIYVQLSYSAIQTSVAYILIYIDPILYRY